MVSDYELYSQSSLPSPFRVTRSPQSTRLSRAVTVLPRLIAHRESEGSLVRHENFVFLDVTWLVTIVKPLLNHKDTENRDGDVCLGEMGDSIVTLEKHEDIRSWNRLKREGVLEPELAVVIWPKLSKYVLPTLACLGLTFPLEGDPAGGLVVLLRLPEERPDSVGEDLEEFRKKHKAVLSVHWSMHLGVPPGAIEKVLTRCCYIGAVQTFWRFGVLVKGNFLGQDRGGGSFALLMEYSLDKAELLMEVYGNIVTAAPWTALAYGLSAVRTMTLGFPGLPWRGYLKCPHLKHDERMLIKKVSVGFRLI